MSTSSPPTDLTAVEQELLHWLDTCECMLQFHDQHLSGVVFKPHVDQQHITKHAQTQTHQHLLHHCFRVLTAYTETLQETVKPVTVPSS